MSKAILEGIEQLKTENTRLLAEVERLQAQTAAIREALEAVEWVEVEGHEFCPWCGNWYVDGHRPDCLRQIALSAEAGRELLKRLQIVQAQRDHQNEQIRQLERERDKARATLTAVHDNQIAILRMGK